jgi:hypothetical protein
MNYLNDSRKKKDEKTGKRISIIFFSTLIIFVFLFILNVSTALAYRPFISTDAAVASVKEWEIELGFFSMKRDNGQSEIFIPSLRINFGILKNWEIVGEFDLQVYKEGIDRNSELTDPALFLKGVLREGILQNQEGASFVVELGVLFPSTVEGERGAGIEGIIVFSNRISHLVYHFNLGAEYDRKDFSLHGIWGIILEYPFEGRFRLVGEVNGTFTRNGPSENSGLIGLIWEVGGFDLDFGIRKGFSAASSDWALTTGIAISF